VKNIYFSGVIGVGKTTIGKAIAERLNRPFDDLDRAIEREAGMTIGEVVAREGWLQYRSLEYSICKKFAQMDKAVIAMAGGTPRYEWNRDVLKGSGLNILLVADLSILPGRVGDHDRPRVNPVSSLAEDLVRIWKEYGDVYLGFSDIVYPTDQGKTIDEEINELLQILQKNFPDFLSI
jgi:shikimate kinase